MLDILLKNLPYLLRGAVETLKLVSVSIPLGTALGLLLGVLSVIAPGWVRWLVGGFGLFVRGIPVLVWMFLAYYTLPAVGAAVGDFATVVSALGLYTAAFTQEIARGAILSVPKGQIDSARSLGMRWPTMLREVVLPQAAKLSVAPLVNNSVMMVKFSAYAAVVGVWELTYAAREVVERTLAPIEIFFGVMMIYFCVCYPLSLLARFLEKRLAFEH